MIRKKSGNSKPLNSRDQTRNKGGNGLKFLAKKVCGFIENNCDLTVDEKKLVEYGGWIIFDTTIKYFCMIVIATVLLDFMTACIMAVCFALLRVKAGGYHAKSSFMCGFWMLVIITISAFIGKYLTVTTNMVLYIWIFLCILFYIALTKRGDKNKSLKVLFLITIFSGIAIFYIRGRTAIMFVMLLDLFTVLAPQKVEENDKVASSI